MSYLNFLLAGFNLVPALPLDGGRVFRSILWGWKNNLKWATRLTSRIGSGFGLVLIFFGVLYIIRGVFISGIWWFLIGLFLRNASQMSYSRLLMSKALEGEPVKRFMKKDPITAPLSIRGEKFVDEDLYKHHFKMFPVVDDGKLIGCISTHYTVLCKIILQILICLYATAFVYAGCIEGNCSNGQGTYTWTGAGKYIGQFKDGKMHGQGTKTWVDGRKYTGEFKDDKMHGQGTYTWANGAQYIGQFKAGKKNGQGTYTWADGAQYIGQFKDDKMHGKGTYMWANGRQTEGQWKDDEMLPKGSEQK